MLIEAQLSQMRKLILLTISVAIAASLMFISPSQSQAEKETRLPDIGLKSKLAQISKTFMMSRIKPNSPKTVRPGGAGVKQVLVVPLYFEDQKYTYIHDSLKDKFERGKEKSLSGYYYDASGGKMDIQFGSTGVLDWQKMPRKVSEYGLKPQSYDGWDELFKDIDKVLLGLSKKIDMGQFDLDHNGNPDITILVWAGNSGTVGGPMPGDFTFYGDDGSSYICIGEDVQFGFPLITILHEFAHASIPLWDLYDYSYTSSPVGAWDLMSDGVWSDFCGLCAYHRWKSGWLDPITITEPGTYYVDDLNGDDPNKMYKIPIPGSEDEWILVENRTRKGCDGYFQGAPDYGMVVYHIDDKRPYEHRFNTLGPDRDGVVWRTHGVTVLDPSGSTLHKSGVYGKDVARTKITAQTTPNTLPYRKGNSDKTISITEISERGARMSFRVDFVAPEKPMVSVDQQVFFGKIVKGRSATKLVTFRNVGVGKLFIQMKPSDNCMTLDRSNFIGNDEDINITVETASLKFGKYTMKVNYSNQSTDVQGYIECFFEVVPTEGDIDANGKVDQADLDTFMKFYGMTGEDDGFNSKCDFNSDGKIDFLDLLLLAKNFKPAS
jgi:M6 family metalloprotease-like protein